MSPGRMVCVATLSIFLIAGGARGQAIRGSVVDAGTRAPVPGALVVLLDGQGARVKTVLTNEAGQYLLLAPGAGRYRVQVEMIGRHNATSEPLDVGAGETEEFWAQLSPQPISLQGIKVAAARRCRLLPEGGVATQAVWEEARKALEVMQLTQAEQRYRFQLVGYQRDYDAQGRRVKKEQSWRRTSTAQDPFTSLSARRLADEGFVHPTPDGGATLYGPNGAVLLSDIFLDSHCFELTQDREHEGEVGLRFQPVAGRRLSDIEGTLWLRRTTAELVSLDFSYVHLPDNLPAGDYRGHAAFRRLPSGRWIIPEWWIRSPLVALQRGMFRGERVESTVLIGIRQSGGEVLQTLDRRGRVVTETPRAVITGEVYDSVAGRPLRDAVVWVVGTDWQDTTDANGGYRLTGLPPGEYSLGFTHPLLGALDYRPEAVTVQLVAGRETRQDLWLPREVLTTHGGGARRDSVAAVSRSLGLGWEPLLEAESRNKEQSAENARWQLLNNAGFFTRREHGRGGVFMTADEIARRSPRTLSDLLLEIVPGAEQATGSGELRFDPRARDPLWRDGLCEPDVYVAGTLERSRHDRLAAGRKLTLQELDAVDWRAVDALEVYVGRSAAFPDVSRCGLVLIWSRRLGAENGSRP